MQHIIIIETEDVVVVGETLDENEGLGPRDGEEVLKYVLRPHASSLTDA